MAEDKLGLAGREDSLEDRAAEESSVLWDVLRDMSWFAEAARFVLRFARIWAQ